MPVTTSVSSALTDVPAILRPYLTDKGGILPAAQTFLGKSYAENYGNELAKANLAGSQRVAGMSPMQAKVGTELANMGTPNQFAAGTNAVNYGIGTLQGMTDPGQTQAFMSPYIQNVLDVNKQEAMRDSQRNLLSQNLGAGRTGSYGNSANILAQAEAQRNFQTQLAKIQSAGMQSAFEDARKSQLGQAAGLTQAGNTMGALGTAQSAADIDRIKTQGAYGDLQRAIQQQQLDSQYKDLMERLNYPLTTYETMSNLVRGVPLTQTGGTTATTTPAPSFASQFAGMGMTGLGLYNLFK
jgi:hypothetical protein